MEFFTRLQCLPDLFDGDVELAACHLGAFVDIKTGRFFLYPSCDCHCCIYYIVLRSSPCQIMKLHYSCPCMKAGVHIDSSVKAEHEVVSLILLLIYCPFADSFRFGRIAGFGSPVARSIPETSNATDPFSGHSLPYHTTSTNGASTESSRSYYIN